MTTRRSIISLLGLGPITALGTETFAKGISDIQTHHQFSSTTMSAALRKMADAIDEGAIGVTGINVHSHADIDDIMRHTLWINFLYFEETKVG